MRILEMDVDDVLFEYLERVQRLQAPSAGKMIDDSGLSYAPSCECGGRDRVFEPINLEGAGDEVFERWICAACDQLWVFARGEIAVREIQRPASTGAFEHEWDEAEKLAQALRLLGEWEARLYLQLYLWENMHDRTEIANQANRRWSTVRYRRWTEWHVRQTISGAQRKIFEELGLLSRSRKNPTMKLSDHFRRNQPAKL